MPYPPGNSPPSARHSSHWRRPSTRMQDWVQGLQLPERTAWLIACQHKVRVALSDVAVKGVIKPDKLGHSTRAFIVFHIQPGCRL